MYEAIDFETLKNEMKLEKLINESVDAPKANANTNLINKTEETLKIEQHPQIKFKIINSFYLYNYMQLLLDEDINKTMYIIDLRDEKLYKESHLKNAIHIKNVTKLNKAITKMKTEVSTNNNTSSNANTYNRIKGKKKVIFYDNKVAENLKTYSQFLSPIFANVYADFYFLKEGFKHFENVYSFLCVSKNMNCDNMQINPIPFVPYVINYPMKFCNNVYLGHIIHINNSYVNHFLKIKYIYDFTSSGFSIKHDEHVTYFRYNVIKKKLENKNSLKGESINFNNFLDNYMVYQVIYNIAKNYNEKIDNNLLINEEGENMDRTDTLIICNEGITNKTKKSMNNIGLIICMCYVMYIKKYNFNLIMTYILKIYNNLDINFKVQIFLKSFYNSLEKNNFDLSVCCSLKSGRNNDNVTCNGSSSSSKSSESSSSKSSRSIKIEQNSRNNMPYLNDNTKRLINLFKSDKFINLIKKYEINNSYIMLYRSDEYILYINPSKNILTDMNIIKQKVKNKEYKSYEVVMHSLLYYIYNNNFIILTNFYDINNFLEIFILIINDSEVEYPFKMPYIALILINMCKVLMQEDTHLKYDSSKKMQSQTGTATTTATTTTTTTTTTTNTTNTTNTTQTFAAEYECLKGNVLNLIYYNVVICIDFFINNITYTTELNQTKKEEYKLTIKTKNEYLTEKCISKNIYLMLLSLKYLLATFFHFYVYPTIKKFTFSYLDMIYQLLKKIDILADCYYSIFNVNINLFNKNDYNAKVCFHDYLPLYFSDILRPFVIINNYLFGNLEHTI
ncbi:mitogen-activated protein kinase phosphatase 1, putative [Hepatocystis sp. ex Piliocolobus tephrosceles]|nr:mitogen-activated protein kinase phosphatase 1, putative [Hepatocystis sp. ex Piliocolobus tephrosceles]